MKPEKINNIVSDPLEPVAETPIETAAAELEKAVAEIPTPEEPKEVAEAAKPEPKKDNSKYIVADTPKLNVRETPNGKIIKVIESGEEVVLGGKSEDKDWYKIKSPIQGYVMKKYIKKV